MRAFLVPNDARGFAVGRLEHKLGQRLSSAEILGEDANDPTWGVEKCMRDAKLAQIFEGTNQNNRLHVARGILDRA